jgi:hypothetical protein
MVQPNSIENEDFSKLNETLASVVEKSSESSTRFNFRICGLGNNPIDLHEVDDELTPKIEGYPEKALEQGFLKPEDIEYLRPDARISFLEADEDKEGRKYLAELGVNPNVLQSGITIYAFSKENPEVPIGVMNVVFQQLAVYDGYFTYIKDGKFTHLRNLINEGVARVNKFDGSLDKMVTITSGWRYIAENYRARGLMRELANMEEILVAEIESTVAENGMPFLRMYEQDGELKGTPERREVALLSWFSRPETRQNYLAGSNLTDIAEGNPVLYSLINEISEKLNLANSQEMLELIIGAERGSQLDTDVSRVAQEILQSKLTKPVKDRGEKSIGELLGVSSEGAQGGESYIKSIGFKYENVYHLVSGGKVLWK